MSDRKLTLLELHLHNDGDVQVGPRSLRDGLLGGDDEPEPRPEPPRPDGGTTEESGVSLPLVAGGLALLGLAAAAAWRALRQR